MDLTFTDQEQAFCEEVRSFVRDSLPGSIRQKMLANIELSKDDLVNWTRILDARGWAVPHWPVEWGGTGWPALQQALFIDVMQQELAPDTLSFGTSMVGPIIYTFGTDAQKRRFLPRIVNLQDWWCQGFSEPGAGSDLASLRTTAVREGDHYIVNGQKTWTTLAQHADWIFCLVRTDRTVKKQAGISFLLIDMKSSGVSVNPIQTIDGGYEINDVFLDNVRVPAENLVGEENRGWDYAKFLLQHERSGIARVGASKALLRRLRALCEQEERKTPDRRDLAQIRLRAAELEVELKALELTQYRVIAEESRADADSQSPAASILKIKGSEIQQAISELMLDLAGQNALVPLADDPEDAEQAWSAPVAATYMNWRKVSIYGGSNEIQRTLIARQLLAS